MDRALVERAQRGDESAFAMLATDIANRMYATAHHILRDADQADDAAQQAMISIWRELPRLNDPARIEGWAYRIVVRAAYAESRRAKRSLLARHRGAVRAIAPVGAGDIEVGDDGLVPDAAQEVLDRDELARGFSCLPLDQRVVLVLKHYVGLSNAEIAEVVDVPEGTVRSRLHYAMANLRAALEADARLRGVETRP